MSRLLLPRISPTLGRPWVGLARCEEVLGEEDRDDVIVRAEGSSTLNYPFDSGPHRVPRTADGLRSKSQVGTVRVSLDLE